MKLASRRARRLPAPVRRAGRGTLNYIERIKIWGIILREIEGEALFDQRWLRRSALAAPITAWGRFYRWRNPVLLRDIDVRVPALGRFRVHARCDELYLVLPRREAAVYAAARALLRPGDTVVDAGANIGAFSVFAARLIGPGGHLIAIEMMPRTAVRLRANLARNGLTADIVEAALAASPGLTVTAAIDPAKGGQATLALAHTLDRPETLSMTTRTLDEVLSGVGRIALLKLDIEGAELDALAGARATLARTDAIIFEQLDDAGAIVAAVSRAGFAVRQLDRHNYLARRQES
ncbi:methyltransferase, FkbM family [Novosphingobium sp. CF614]|uniref:FkbM family methyltransferase n=1 Tax=Novosphingobium sp. CF614 TaxID=1884364 RepID=UPI0008E140DB|nr:FkbM family methyltransferase [Novosphingobium sp. CF614]SFG20623.1 methyltransferase, FkbM family [Novosphingobium sp. CF614]